ncbi:MAG TPA: diguanylate cyclase [Anaerolineales bacterium]|nr:diguanylate cyclase [Anaerolineales bacterium]
MATILIVDPHSADRRIYVTLLGNFGHRLLEAADGVQALEIARRELPELVITNILMPHMDGFTLARRLRSEPLLTAVQIIFHTEHYFESEVRKLAIASGVQHILGKPADPQEILRAVQEALRRPTTPTRLPQTGQLQREHLQLLADKLYEKVAELEKANSRLHNLSLTDSLTGLNNRRGFMILATALLKFARRAGHPLCLLYIDLDSLKYTNDTFGHAAGDATIIQFAQILTDTFRESDVIGRLGGDEFVALTIDAAESDLSNIQKRLQDNVDLHNLKPGKAHPLAFSLGVIPVDIDSTFTMEELLAQADAAMYKHKQLRRRTT